MFPDRREVKHNEDPAIDKYLIHHTFVFYPRKSHKNQLEIIVEYLPARFIGIKYIE